MIEKIHQTEVLKYTSDLTKQVLFDSKNREEAVPFYEVTIKVDKKDSQSHFTHPQTTESFTETWHVQNIDELLELVKSMKQLI